MRKYSLVMPVYNAARYLPEMLASVAAQTYENWELILVDDGSTDESGKICDAFAAEFPEKVSVIHQENQGLLQARRTGLSAVSGDYFWNVDADDGLSADALVDIDAALALTESDFLFFNFSFDSDFSKAAMSFPFGNLTTFAGADKESIYRMTCETVNMNPIWNKVVETDLLSADGDYAEYGRNVAMGEDLFQVLPWMDTVKKIAYLDKNLYFYRLNAASMTKNRLDFADVTSVEIVLERLYDYVDKWQLPDGARLKEQKTKLYLTERLSAVSRTKISSHREEVSAFLTTFSRDNFFRKFYENRQLIKLSWNEAMIFRLLYQGKIKRLMRLYQLNQRLRRS